MSRRLLIPVLILFILSAACNFSSVIGSAATPTVPAPKPATEVPVVEVATPTVEIMPTEPPTREPEPTEVPTEAGPTNTPVPVGPQPFTEDFDSPNPPGWKYIYIAGTEAGNRIFVEDSQLKFEIVPRETYAYVYNENEKYEDVIVEATADNTGADVNAMVVTCRMSEKGWYEMRISSDGKMVVYRYDQIKKDRHENPYTWIIPQINLNQINPGFKSNTFALSCIGNELRPFINGTEIVYNNKTATDDKYKDGYVGIGAMSFNNSNIKVKVGFDSVSAKLP